MSEWTGPVQFDLDIFGDHTNTVRYRCCYDNNKYFDYYVPKAVLEGQPGNWPEKIRVIMMKSDLPRRELGFFGRLIAPRTETDFWEYDFLRENVNSIRYEVRYEGQGYSVYAPRAVFENLSFPDRLLVYIGVIE